jgi:hypothetical protein
VLIIVSMVIPTVGFIAAGSVDPRVHPARDCEIVAGGPSPEMRCGEPFAIVADHSYPTPAVLMSGGLVLAEGLILSLILTVVRSSIAWRALLAAVAAGIPAAEMRSATLGLPPWYGYATYHLLWLMCAAALMFALLLVGATDAALRRFCRTAPASQGAADGRSVADGPARSLTAKSWAGGPRRRVNF